MALQHGTKARAKRHSQLTQPPKRGDDNRFVGSVAFVFLATAAVALVAATLLLPAWAEHLVVRHEAETLAARNADLRARIAAGEHMATAAQTDSVFIERLALSQGEFEPIGQRAIGPDNGAPLPPPDMVDYAVATRPDPPPAWVLRAGRKLQRPRTQRGFLVLAGGILLTAGLMFSPAGQQPPGKSRPRK